MNRIENWKRRKKMKSEEWKGEKKKNRNRLRILYKWMTVLILNESSYYTAVATAGLFSCLWRVVRIDKTLSLSFGFIFCTLMFYPSLWTKWCWKELTCALSVSSLWNSSNWSMFVLFSLILSKMSNTYTSSSMIKWNIQIIC
jgi:hypothetical protein